VTAGFDRPEPEPKVPDQRFGGLVEHPLDAFIEDSRTASALPPLMMKLGERLETLGEFGVASEADLGACRF
jgi:hypothetical protein